MGLFDFFKKKSPAPAKSYTDTSSLAGIERASRTKKPSLLSDIQMGLGLKEKDASYKIRTAQTIQRQREAAKKQAEKKRLEHDDRDVERKSAEAKEKKVEEKPKTDEELYAQMKAYEQQQRRAFGQAKRKRYERAVGKKVAERRRKIQLLLM